MFQINPSQPLTLCKHGSVNTASISQVSKVHMYRVRYLKVVIRKYKVDGYWRAVPAFFTAWTDVTRTSSPVSNIGITSIIIVISKFPDRLSTYNSCDLTYLM